MTEYTVADMRGGFIKVTFSDSNIPVVRTVEILAAMGREFFGESAPLAVENTTKQ